jgi:hypothetical protein
LLEKRSSISSSNFENIFVCKSQWNIICSTQTIVSMAMNSNLLEAVFYYKIFRRMQW